MATARIGSVTQTDNVGIFSIIFDGSNLNEFDSFVEKFKNDADLQSDLNVVFSVIGKILQNGALERYFRYEGKQGDNVVAIPTFKTRLRLYCLRMSDSILIIGNGGKKDSRTYQESAELNGYVISLQMRQEMIAQVPSDTKKQYDYSFDLSDRIDEQMKAQGISRRELARRTGKRPSEVTRWLSGQHNFTLATIAKLSVALNHDFLKIV